MAAQLKRPQGQQLLIGSRHPTAQLLFGVAPTHDPGGA